MARIHAFDFLHADPADAPVAVLFGNIPLLRQLSRTRLLQQWAEEADVSEFDGAKRRASWRDVRDELSTVSLFGGGRRLVLVHDADDFISEHRSELEKYVAEPLRSGRLILEPSSFPGNTKLAKAVDKSGLVVDCRLPELKRGRGKPVTDTARITQWLCERAESEHGCQLELTAAQAMLELIGPELGLLDQELGRLALFVEPGAKLPAKTVRQLCGGWRTQTTWVMIDAALDGDTVEALRQLAQLLQSGESPQALFAQVAWSLRRFVSAARWYTLSLQHGQRPSLQEALKEAGFQPYRLADGERQLRRIGAERAGRLMDWLMEADLALKGSHSAEARGRLVLERLVLRISAERVDPQRPRKPGRGRATQPG